MLDVILSSVVPVLCTIMLGFAWVRFGRPLDSKVLTPIVVEVGTPCLIVSTLFKASIAPEAFATIALASCVAIGAFAAVGGLVLWSFGLPLRTYLPSIAFPNAGNLGRPLALYAFGPEGLGYAIVFFAISSIGNHSIGQMLAAGTVDWKAIARMPMLYAITIGLAGSYFQIQPPSWFANTTALIGGLSRAIGLSALRIGAGGIIGAMVANLFKRCNSQPDERAAQHQKHDRNCLVQRTNPASRPATAPTRAGRLCFASTCADRPAQPAN